MTPSADRDGAESSADSGLPVVLVSVGTDHHPFHRMIDWVDEWLENGAQGKVRCVVQYGHSKAPRVAEGSSLIPHEELQQLMRTAAIIVSHGGPTTIMEARGRGLIPVVVPRVGANGEHIDNHQQLFAQRMSDGGLVALAGEKSEFMRVMDDALANPSSLHVLDFDEDDNSVAEASAYFGQLVEEMLGHSQPIARTPVLFIGGSGRSGTTLIERILGQIDGVHAAGELVHLWERSVVEDQLCGCGEHFSACDTWQQVGQDAYGGWDKVDATWAVDSRWAVDRTRFVPRLLWPRLATPFNRRRMRAWARHLGHLYRGLAHTPATRLVIDSSKHLSYALLLRHAPVDLKVLVIVRDPRAVAYSWSKVAVRPEITDSEEYMPQFSAFKSSAIWVINALGYGLLKLVGVPVLTMRYEDFVAEPESSLRAVSEFCGVDASTAGLQGASINLAANHTAAGNPMRMHIGDIELRPDRSWLGALGRKERWITTAMTWPWLIRFGYPLTTSRVRP